MSMDEADRAVAAASAAATGVTPLLRSLGDADAALCIDGFCAVPPAAAAASQITTSQATTSQATTSQASTGASE
jgi:hypothetical protein